MLDLVNEPDGYCEDRYIFDSDGTVKVMSGEEVVEKTWRLEQVDAYKRKLVQDVVSTNGQPDCQGNVSKVGAVSETYVVFRNGGGWMLCAGPDVGMSCYGSVNPYLPAASKLPEPSAEVLEHQRALEVKVQVLRSKGECEGGDMAACATYGSALYRGVGGMAQDFKLARETYKTACAAGQVQGCVGYSTMLLNGEGGREDARTARKAITPYCTETEFAGCQNLGAMQLSGKGGKSDLAGARVSLERACTHLDRVDACHSLGIMFANGMGGTADNGVAARYLDQACSLGSEKACEDAEELSAVAETKE